jgi:hypothetical protein
MDEPTRVLVVANRTAVGQPLLDEVERRASAESVHFHLLVPATPKGLHRVVDPEVSGRAEAHEQLQRALPALSAAAGTEVTGHVGDSDPLAAIQDAVAEQQFDEIIVSTLPRRLSRWLRLGLPDKVTGLGLPVTHVRPERAGQARKQESVPA